MKVGHIGLKMKITFLFACIVGVSLVTYSFYLYKSFREISQESFDILLYNSAVELAENIEVSIMGNLRINPRIITEMRKGARKFIPFSFRESFFQIRMADGRLLDKSYNLKEEEIPMTQKELSLLMMHNWLVRDWTKPGLVDDTSHFRVVDYIIYRGFQYPRLVLQIAVPNRYVEANIKNVLKLFQVSIPLIVLLSVVVGYYFAGLAIEPVNRIIKKARSIDVKRLKERIPLPTTNDEIRELVMTLNGLLERLEKSFSAQDRFISDASHQLKTPLAVIRVETEQLMKLSGDDPQKLEVLDSIREEVDHLTQLVQNLLILARVESHDATLKLDVLRLDEVVMSAVEKVNKLAQKKNTTLQVDFIGDVDECKGEQFLIRGDNDLLASLLVNLLENSLKYSPENSCIKVHLEDQPEKLRVIIQDEGPGIQAGDLDRVFERFYRGKTARNQGLGSGLGLSIARRIADLHGADLGISNLSHGGAEVHFDIKKV